jgi:5-methylcytosine-specific restriction endonuclease McrA
MKVIQLITTANGSYYDQFKKLYLHPYWQRRRLEILSRDDFKCTKCGCDDLPLHIHHDYYEYGLKPWEYEDEYLRTLCEDCHEEYHMCHAA